MIRGGFGGPGPSVMKLMEILAWGEKLDQDLATGKRYPWQLTKAERNALSAHRNHNKRKR